LSCPRFCAGGQKNKIIIIIRHHALNDLVARAFTSAALPSSKEPHGLLWSDGKRPDGITLVPWKGGKPLSWDVTAVCTVAGSYVAATAREASAAAERAAELKIAKYSSLEDKCIFQPIVVESLDPLNETACQFLKDLGRSISAQSGDERESAFLFQRLSVLITLHAKLRYCNWSCLCVCAFVCLWVGLLPR